MREKSGYEAGKGGGKIEVWSSALRSSAMGNGIHLTEKWKCQINVKLPQGVALLLCLYIVISWPFGAFLLDLLL